MKSKEEIEKMVKVFRKLMDETDASILKMSAISDKEVAKNFVESNTTLRESYKSFIDGLEWVLEP